MLVAGKQDPALELHSSFPPLIPLFGALGFSDEPVKQSGEKHEVTHESRDHGGTCQCAEEGNPRHRAGHRGKKSAGNDGGSDQERQTDGFKGAHERQTDICAFPAFAEEADEEMDGVIYRDAKADAEGEDAADLEWLVQMIEEPGIKEKGEAIGDDAQKP